MLYENSNELRISDTSVLKILQSSLAVDEYMFICTLHVAKVIKLYNFFEGKEQYYTLSEVKKPKGKIGKCNRHGIPKFEWIVDN